MVVGVEESEIDSEVVDVDSDSSSEIVAEAEPDWDLCGLYGLKRSTSITEEGSRPNLKGVSEHTQRHY